MPATTAAHIALAIRLELLRALRVSDPLDWWHQLLMTLDLEPATLRLD